MLRINLNKKADSSKIDTLATCKIACLSFLFEEEQHKKKKSRLLTRGSLKFEKIEHIQILLQSCKRHQLPIYYMVTC